MRRETRDRTVRIKGAKLWSLLKSLNTLPPPPGGGVFKKFLGWGCAAGTLEPSAYTRASSAEFCYSIYTRLNSPNPPYPREAFRLSCINLNLPSEWVTIPNFPSLDLNRQPIVQLPGEWWPILDPNSLIYIPYPRVNCLKAIPFTVAHTYIAHMWQWPPGTLLSY